MGLSPLELVELVSVVRVHFEGLPSVRFFAASLSRRADGSRWTLPGQRREISCVVASLPQIQGKPLLADAKQTTPQTARRIKQLGDQLKSAAARYSKLHQEAVPELALACAGCSRNRSETVPHGRGSTYGTDPWIQAKKGLAGRIPAAVRTRQPCAGDPRWARRVANAVLILRVLMLQCRRVTGESLERSGSFLA